MAYRYHYQKDNTGKILVGLAIAVFIILIFSLVYSGKLLPVNMPDIFSLPDLSTAGYIQMTPEASVTDSVGIVSLTGGCYQVIANTEPWQAESIANGIAGKIAFRPNTHDLTKSIFESLGIDIVMVKIVEIRNSTFIGKLILKQGNNVLSLDSRPSDGIALAVRTNASVYMKEELAKSQGKYVC